MQELERLLAERYGLRPLDGRAVRRAVSEHLGQALDADGMMTGQHIAADPGLVRRLAGTLTVGETYFFRHAEHEDELVEQIAGRLAVQPKVHVWSAGCASGEEPYSLAILARERLGEAVSNRVRIVATDLNERAVVAAKVGKYGEWSLRATSQGRRARWFTREANAFALSETVRACVRFFPLSIQEHLALMAPRSVDLILFRNVGVYLTASALEGLFQGFRRVLAPEGMLAQAATDPAPPPDAFARTNHASTSLFIAADDPTSKHRRAAIPR